MTVRRYNYARVKLKLRHHEVKTLVNGLSCQTIDIDSIKDRDAILCEQVGS